jgi:carbohydrate-selective porin OprB
MRVGIVLVVFLLQLGPSRAQQQPAQSTVGLATLQPSATAAIYPALYSPPFGAEHALGDWAGVRTWLEDLGVDIGLNYFAEPPRDRRGWPAPRDRLYIADRAFS